MSFLVRCQRNWHYKYNAIVLAKVKVSNQCFSYTACRNQSLAPLNYINGERSYPTGSDSFNLREPATGKLLGVVNCSANEDVTSAVSAAGNAFTKWSALSGIERAKVLHRAADIVRQRQDEIAKWDSVDTGGYDDPVFLQGERQKYFQLDTTRWINCAKLNIEFKYKNTVVVSSVPKSWLMVIFF
jgi:hypothetical protein